MNLNLDEFLSTRSLVLKVNEKQLHEDIIVSLEIYWDVNEFYTHGTLIFRDELNFSENGFITTNSIVDITFEDLLNEKFNRKFTVLDVEEVFPDNKFKTLIVRFIDNTSFELIKAFECKGYKEPNLQKIITDTIAKYSKTEINWLLKRELKYSNGNNESLIIPGDRSFLTTLYRLTSEQDFLMFQRRENIIVVDLKQLLSQKPLEDKDKNIRQFKDISENNKFLNKIGDMKNNFGRGLSNNIIIPNAKIQTYDYNTKKLNTKKIDFKTTIESCGSLTKNTVEIIKGQKEDKLLYNTYNSLSIDNLYKKYTNKMFEMEILVPGTHTNNVGDIIDVLLNSKNKGADPDKNNSGRYLITKITDKIVNGYFVQLLTISRAGTF